MSSQIADMIRACRKCQRNRPEHSEPLMPLEFPERPWERIGTDLYHWHNSEYLIAVETVEVVLRTPWHTGGRYVR